MIVRLCGWMGAVCMMTAPFLIDYDTGKLLAVTGLTLLSVQAYHLKVWNLLLLNSVSIIGFIWSILQ